MVGLNWSTFLIEIVNFVVLVWLLTRFLYQPIRTAIAKRRATIAQQLGEANELKAHGEALQKQYDERLVAWGGEKAQLKAQFESELAELRSAREAALASELDRRREQEAAAARARDAERERDLARTAVKKAAAFSSLLLSRIASPEVETRIVDVALADLRALDETARAPLAHALDSGAGAVVVTTCYPLDDARRASISAGLTRALGASPNIRFEQSQALIAGIRIDLGTASLEADIADELQWFAENGNARV